MCVYDMFHTTGGLFGRSFFDLQDLKQKIFDGLVAESDIGRVFFTLGGKGDS